MKYTIVLVLLLAACNTVQPAASGYTAGVLDSKALEPRTGDSKATLEAKELAKKVTLNADKEIAEARAQAQYAVKQAKADVQQAKAEAARAVMIWQMITGACVIASIGLIIFLFARRRL